MGGHSVARPTLRWFIVLSLLAGWIVGRADPGSSQILTGTQLPVVEHELANGMRWLVLPRTGAPPCPSSSSFGWVPSTSPGANGHSPPARAPAVQGIGDARHTDATAERVLFARMDALQDSILALEGRGESTAVPLLKERIDSLETEARAHVLPNEFERVLSTNGARGLNATTDWESTTYFVELPANRAQLWFVLESDRMANPVFREFYAERDIVAEERRLRVETSPGGLLVEAHMAEVFTTIHMDDQRWVTCPTSNDSAGRTWKHTFAATMGPATPSSRSSGTSTPIRFWHGQTNISEVFPPARLRGQSCRPSPLKVENEE